MIGDPYDEQLAPCDSPTVASVNVVVLERPPMRIRGFLAALITSLHPLPRTPSFASCLVEANQEQGVHTSLVSRWMNLTVSTSLQQSCWAVSQRVQDLPHGDRG
jgi:hypothetical protein